MPETFFLRHSPCSLLYPCFDAFVHPQSTTWALCFYPASVGPCRPDFSNQLQRADPSLPGVRHLAKYEYTVTQFWIIPGNILHWQAVRNTYNTPQNTSYKSTVVGFVRLRTPSSTDRISSNFFLLISLAWLFHPTIFMPQKIVNTMAI